MTAETQGGRSAQLKHTGLRPGWTTGACATAATTAAYTALLTGDFPDPVSITLPKGHTPAFPLAGEELAEGQPSARLVKDVGDDGRVVGTADRRLPGPGVHHAAEGPDPGLRAGGGGAGGRAGERRGGEGRGRRPGRDARGAGEVDGTEAAARLRRGVPGRPGR